MERIYVMAFIVIGSIAIVLQIMSFVGNISSGSLDFFANVPNFETFVYDLMRFFGFNLIGIVGIALVIVGIVRTKRSKK